MEEIFEEVGRRIEGGAIGREGFEKLVREHFVRPVNLTGFFKVNLEGSLEFVNPNGSGYFFSYSLRGEADEYIGRFLERIDERRKGGFGILLQFVDSDRKFAGFSWRAGNG